ncbi:MAG TPA: DinB family protein [Bryobacteraceae bacterium]|nr:DinB family protein [Bryobacteraceae bacterium]
MPIPNAGRCLHVLRETPATLRNLLALAAPEQLQWRPSADRWSIAMILAHLAQAEVKGFQNRFQAMLAADQPLLPAYDQTELFRSGTVFAPDVELARFEDARAVTLRLLDAMPDGAGERTGRHEELGILTIAQLLNEFAFHDLGHIRQAIEIYRSCVFFPEMGVYRSYYRINP